MPKIFANINIETQIKHFAKRCEYIEFIKSKDIKAKNKLGGTDVDNKLPGENFDYVLRSKSFDSMKNIIGK